MLIFYFLIPFLIDFMNCCRGERVTSARPKGKYDDFFQEILAQIPNTTYTALYDRANNFLVAESYFCGRRDERFADQASHVHYNVEPLMALLHRTRDIGGSANDATEPTVLLLTTSMGHVFCVLSVPCQHSLIVATLFDPSDASEITGAIFELRLRSIIGKIGAAIAS